MKNIAILGIASLALGLSAMEADAKGRYERVPVKTAAIAPEKGMVQLMTELRGAIARKDRTAIYGMLAPKFLLTRDLAGDYNAKYSARKQFDVVFKGWDGLTEIVNAASWGPNEKGSKLICGPATLTDADEKKIIAAAKQRGDDPENTYYEWLYVDAADVPVLEKPDLSASKMTTLNHEAVRALGGGNTNWIEVGLPDGSIGYVESKHLLSMQPERLCLTKNKGKWRIGGFEGGGD